MTGANTVVSQSYPILLLITTYIFMRAAQYRMIPGYRVYIYPPVTRTC
jgi:hypothetical protein